MGRARKIGTRSQASRRRKCREVGGMSGLEVLGVGLDASSTLDVQTWRE